VVSLSRLPVLIISSLCIFMMTILSDGAHATHDGFHRYSGGGENNAGADRGIEVTRWDNSMAGIPNDGCANPISGHPMYQTQWLITGTGWIEIGTGHQCNDTNRYWFWGYGNPNWTLIDSQAITGTQKHKFRLERSDTTTWRFFVDVTALAGTLSWSTTGTRVEAGLESYAANGQTLNSGNPGTQNYELMAYKTAANAWAYWAGQDYTVGPDSPLCGDWVISTTWRSGANVVC